VLAERSEEVLRIRSSIPVDLHPGGTPDFWVPGVQVILSLGTPGVREPHAYGGPDQGPVPAEGRSYPGAPPATT